MQISKVRGSGEGQMAVDSIILMGQNDLNGVFSVLSIPCFYFASEYLVDWLQSGYEGDFKQYKRSAPGKHLLPYLKLCTLPISKLGFISSLSISTVAFMKGFCSYGIFRCIFNYRPG